MITFWHNPRCSKSRQALALLDAAGAQVEVRRYLEDAPDAAELRAVLDKLGTPAIALVRTGESAFKEQGLSKASDTDALVAAMAATPALIERPVTIRGDRAVMGRPPEAVLTLLD